MTTKPTSSGHTSGTIENTESVAAGGTADSAESNRMGAAPYAAPSPPPAGAGATMGLPPFLGAPADPLPDLPILQTPTYVAGTCPWYFAKLDRQVATAIYENGPLIRVPTPIAYRAAVDEPHVPTPPGT